MNKAGNGLPIILTTNVCNAFQMGLKPFKTSHKVGSSPAHAIVPRQSPEVQGTSYTNAQIEAFRHIAEDMRAKDMENRSTQTGCRLLLVLFTQSSAAMRTCIVLLSF